jgi:hypothetical protein
MKNKLQPILLTLVFLLSGGCYDYDRLFFSTGVIPSLPQNFQEVNSVYDDYNSSIYYQNAINAFLLIFSSTRDSDGNDFDFIHFPCTAIFSKKFGEFKIYLGGYDSPWLIEMIDSVNSSFNELGPLLAEDFHNLHSGSRAWDPYSDTVRFYFANDRNGNLDIYYINGLANGGEKQIKFINSEFDEAYPTLHYHLLPSMYFASNRAGDFDIYRAVSKDNEILVNSDSISVYLEESLSSDADDQCPYIIGNIMVFASDREGGYGGFDLWYSSFDGIEWSDPVNFGNEINTEFDEYRPVIINTSEDWQFINDLMIFSSNRPGGKGGFDLYYVGTEIVFSSPED